MMIIEHLKISVRSLLVMSLLTGVLYPLAITALAQRFFPRQANGSMILRDGKPVGSALIGQPFDDPKFFWGRLSATTPVADNASGSSGSNFCPMNPALLAEIHGRIDALRKYDPDDKDPIPVDLVTSSASGLDPHITPAAARYQLRRVARARGVDEAVVGRLVREHTRGRFLGVLGEPTVNVLELNLALEEIKK
jgi:potassium-transporting ATPase KdpC subunit